MKVKFIYYLGIEGKLFSKEKFMKFSSDNNEFIYFSFKKISNF